MNDEVFNNLFSYLLGKDKSGVYFAPDIPNKKLKNAVKHHGVSSDNILLLYDYTLFGSATESLILTQDGLSFVVNEKEPATFLRWSQIQDIHYNDGKYVFYLDELKGKNISFDKSKVFAPDKKEIEIIEGLLLQIARKFESVELKQIRLIESLFDDCRYDDLIKESSSYLAEHSEEDIFYNEVIFLRSSAFLKLERIQAASNELDKLYNKEKGDIDGLFSLKLDILNSKILSSNTEHAAALDSILNIFEAIEDDEEGKFKSIRDEINFLQKEYYNNFCESFLKIKDDRRNVILIHGDYPKVKTGKFFVLNKSLMPNIEFPFGHPKVNDVYISHPFKEDLYYPVDEMEFRVFVDKIEEYSHFLQSLGAREIKIDTYKNENFTSKSNNNSKVRLDISVEKISSSNNMEINQENESYDSFQQRFNKAMMFSPMKKPHLPDDMVWYPVEPSWQRLYSQRINGNIVEYEEIIKTSHHNTLSEREMLEINSEVNYFFNKAKINRKRTSKSSVNRNKEIEWKIKVVFAPIGELKEDVDTDIVSIERPISADSVYSSDELSFMELIKTALSDSEISDDEMRVIDRQRDRMGISEVRAKELIDSVQRKKSFSPEEVEFIEEIDFCLSVDGQISDDELNLLDRLRVKLNLSKERSQELIEYCSNRNL